MNYEETLSTLKAIQASYSPMPFLLDPDVEPRFVINSDERTIVIPEEFKFLAVKMDHLSERIYFDIPRYFDGEDLATKICVVQYINANGEEVVEGIASIVDVDYTSEADKIIFRWDVDNNVTKYAGDVSFSVRFYTISDDNRFTYSWNTIPATLPVLDTIDNTGQAITENYPTELLQWQYRMTELDRTISDKIADATESIDMNVSAALAARKGAEDAENRVNAIVAGNEAYTKKQSHDLFALALKGTAEAAKSITIYPDKGSNVLATINGFTKQKGSGDASPVNIRPITNGGKYCNKKVFTGSEYWYADNEKSNTFRTDPKMTINSGISTIYKGITYSQAGIVEGIYLSHTLTIIVSDPSCDTVTQFKQKLTNLYEAGTPLIVWFNKRDGEEDEKPKPGAVVYAPLSGVGDGYTGVCGELTAPLCQGDTLITKVKSGCDQQVVLGTTTKFALNGSNTFACILTSPVIAGSKQYSNVYPWSRNVGGNGNRFNVAENALYVVDTNFSTAEEFNAHITALEAAGMPIVVWYRSTNYTDAADIPVSLETHRQAVLVLDGTEDVILASGGHMQVKFPASAQAPAGGADSSNVCSHAKFAYSASGNGFYVLKADASVIFGSAYVQSAGWSSAEDCKAYLAAQYAAGTPVTIVYQLATPITYAHDPIDFIASPDEEGAWVITGEADGTVSAEYNKNITKALEDILTRISALELHALGG